MIDTDSQNHIFIAARRPAMPWTAIAALLEVAVFDKIIVILAVSLALIYVIRVLRRNSRGGGCSCSGCTKSQSDGKNRDYGDKTQVTARPPEARQEENNKSAPPSCCAGRNKKF